MPQNQLAHVSGSLCHPLAVLKTLASERRRMQEEASALHPQGQREALRLGLRFLAFACLMLDHLTMSTLSL